METYQFDRNMDIGESIFVSNIRNLQRNHCFPTRLYDCTEHREKDILALKRESDVKIIIVRRISIQEQTRAEMPNEDNGHGNMIINMSQETENMMTLDIDHTKRIQDDQIKDSRYIENETQNLINNQILRLR